MKVLIFTTAYEPFVGGSEIAIAEIARHLPDISFDVLTPRYTKTLALSEQKNNITIHRVGFGSKLDKWMFPLLGFLKALHLPGDVLHGYQASYGALAAYGTSLFKRAPFVLTLQEGKELDKQNLFIRLLRRFLVKRADRVTAISPYLADYARSIRPGNHIEIIPNGVGSSFFRTSVSEQPVVISVSRLVPKNGLENLILAMKEIPATLWIVGEGPQRNYLENLLNREEISNVVFKGTVQHSELPDLLAQARVFVRPSLSEGLGNAFLEAMACGIPVVGSRVGGIPMFLKHEETGLFCDPKDPKDIAQTISRLLSDASLRSKIIANAQTLVREQFQWQIIAQNMAGVYQTV
ncbi:MAG: glycosyltransferase family 4 protein [Candidatus Yanofskybacteria bacterium]|nr:glycosyltransferase family 4 protein [Candidatus Yanofskybacteria bacterium]